MFTLAGHLYPIDMRTIAVYLVMAQLTQHHQVVQLVLGNMWFALDPPIHTILLMVDMVGFQIPLISLTAQITPIHK